MSTPECQQVLVSVTGRDCPGITSRLLTVVAESQVRLLDIEQVRVHGQLVLVLLLGMERDKNDSVVKDLLFEAKALGIGLELKVVEEDEEALSSPPRRYAITAVADRVEATALRAISKVLAELSINIESIRQLSDSGLGCFEIIAAETGAAERTLDLRRRLLEETDELDVDLAVASEDLLRRSKRLVVMDMDSTLIRIEVIDELARMHGVVGKVSKITARAMAGEIDFEGSLRERVALLKGLEVAKVEQLAANLPLTEGAEDMLQVLKTLGYKTAVISGGFTTAAEALKDKLGLDYAYANCLAARDGKLTGELEGPIVTPQRKADLLDTIVQTEGIGHDQTIAIGDGANDMAMIERAGLGIAFHAKEKLREAADTAVSRGGLDRILFLLGLHARDVDAILKRG
ncbi:MAG: phosphoserine phosphatase SerB [Myxococcales bacterium]|nr:phosphoserine phosphatase SerB [Myxococcales bacterium]